jgi:hypothetical protein
MDRYPNNNFWESPSSGNASLNDHTGIVKVLEITKTEVASPSTQSVPFHQVSSIHPYAVSATPATIAELETNKLRANNTAVGNTLRTLYELDIQRRQEKEAEKKAEAEQEARDEQRSKDSFEKSETTRTLKSQHDFMLSRREQGPQAVGEHESLLKTQHDREMAQRQLRIETLNRQEREEQERWAQEQLMLRGACIRGFQWVRVEGGYMCAGENHAVTDELLAEGKGGYYVRDYLRDPRETIKWLGPVHSREECEQLERGLLNQVLASALSPRMRPGYSRW